MSPRKAKPPRAAKPPREAMSLRAAMVALALIVAAAPLAAHAQSAGGPDPVTPSPSPDRAPNPAQAPNGGGGAAPGGNPYNIGPPPAEAERRYLNADDFRARFENRTVHLSLGPDHYGSEQYLSGDRTVWIFRDGRCQNGDWTFGAGLFCFRYDEARESCWRVFDARGATYAETADRTLTLKIYKVEKEPLSCRPDLVTSLPGALLR